ncbi:hypothetical protein, partial [Enterococcus faecium]|uniref:hypothetical protein n=1 Tax=Enterococcus faecium TaxID=1352 RepID=UPI000B184B9E
QTEGQMLLRFWNYVKQHGTQILTFEIPYAFLFWNYVKQHGTQIRTMHSIAYQNFWNYTL